MISRTAEEHLLHNGITNHVDDFVGKRLALWSNLNILEGVPKVNGSSTLQLRDQRRFESWLYNPTNVWTEGLCDFLSVAYMTSPRSAVEWIARTNRCSMITFGPQALFANPEQTLHALANPSYDPRKRIYLPLEAARTVSATNRGRSELLWHKQTTHSIQAEVTSDVPALMVIAQSYHHCWKPSVDGQPVKLWKANGAFQAFEVPAGQHQILVEYRDNSFRLGVWISLLTAGGCVMAAFRPRSWAFARSRLPEQAVSPEGGALKPA